MQNFLKYSFRVFSVLIWMIIIYFFIMFPSFFPQKESEERSLRVYSWANRIDENMIRSGGSCLVDQWKPRDRGHHN